MRSRRRERQEEISESEEDLGASGELLIKWKNGGERERERERQKRDITETKN